MLCRFPLGTLCRFPLGMVLCLEKQLRCGCVPWSKARCPLPAQQLVALGVASFATYV